MRPTIADIVRESGLSRATVGRVLNGREGVHPRTRALVERSLARLSADEGPVETRPVIDFAVRVDSGMTTQMLQAAACLGGRPHQFHDVYQKSDSAVLAIVRELCEDASRPLVLCVKNTPQMVAELARARRRGKQVIAMIADLAAEARDAFVGIDNRAAGATAAYLIGNTLGARPTTVGFILGDHMFRCHEDREIGFRTALRAHFPRIAVAGEAVGQDSPLVTRAAVRKLLEDHPGIGALYNVSGGNVGLAEAVAEVGRTGDVLVVVHEITDIHVPLLRAGKINFLLSQDPRDLLTEAVRQIDLLRMHRSASEVLVDFGVYTAFNMPSYGNLLIG
jgi:LacI family transcriptional regulator